MLVKKITILFLIQPLTHVCAQQVSFRTFLSEFERSECIDSVSFGKAYDFIDHAEQYSKFLPRTNEECCCEPENVSWQKGSYIKYKNFIAVTLQRYCSSYQDGNSQWFTENDGTDYMLITYSYNGEMLDYKKVGHSGTAYTIHMTALENGLGLVVEQRVLEDCSRLRQYKNLIYTVYTHEYILKSDGIIVERSIDAPHKEVVDVLSSVEQLSFEQFQTYFQKWDRPYVDHTLFTRSKDHAELPFESCLSLIPDTLDHNCWPRDILWLPCRYIENEKFIYFFLIKDCMTPKVGFIPYTDYLVLEFHKNGTFKRARNIYHWDDDSTVTETMIHALITKVVQTVYTETPMPPNANSK
ncbi:MAG: hypothetical protein K2J84_08335 [Bacteroidaceae bacterium]|nr:hypothetical protein [Bacteroidaceae bacterium]